MTALVCRAATAPCAPRGTGPCAPHGARTPRIAHTTRAAAVLWRTDPSAPRSRHSGSMRADRVLQQSARLRAQAAGQAGLVTRAQAQAAGLGGEGLRWALRSQRWVALHPGVYLTTPGRSDWEVRAVAALLHVGAPVALAGASAALAWGLERREPASVHLVVP